MREEGFLALTVGKEWGGSGASFLDHTLAYEVLAEGCPSTALAFNMHASVVMPLLESAEVSTETKQRIAELVVGERKLIAGNFSEPVTTSLIGARPLKARARRADGGYRITGRKMFASMLQAADFVLVMAYPEGATNPSAGIILMLPREADGRIVDPNWDVLGMRATRSDSLILDACWLPESAAVFRSDDMRQFRQSYLNWFWGSYTPVYLGVAQAAFDELRRVVHTRQPEGYAQPLAYHPDVLLRSAPSDRHGGCSREVDDISFEPLQAALAACPDIFRPAVRGWRAVGRAQIAELGGDDVLVAMTPYRAGDQLLVAASTVSIRAVEKIDADLARAAQGVDRRLFIGLVVERRHCRAAETDCRNFKPAEPAPLHAAS